MRILTIVRVLTVMLQGLLAGIFVDYVASRAGRSSLSPSSFVQYQQTVHVLYSAMIPPMLIAAVLAAVIWLWMLRKQWRSAEFWLVVASIVGFITVFVVTGVVNVPINDQLMTWSIEAPPADIKELWAPWEQANTVRTAVAVIAFVLAIVALALADSNKPKTSASPDVA